jgi:chemotaxis protein methyltransferase CheR
VTAGNVTDGFAPLTAAEFERVRRLAHRHFGLDLKEGKQALVEARLSKPLRRRGFSSYKQYCEHVEADSTGEALAELANALTTNFTSFMREPAHFDFLRQVIVPGLPSRSAVEVWSAACSSGEEAYSILFTLLEAMSAGADVRVFATDISTKVLTAAAEGIYTAEATDALPDAWRRRYFLRGNGRYEGKLRVKPEYRDRVEFRHMNLLSGELPSRNFPVVFCRNVMIYFDKPTQEAVVRRLSSRLAPGGHLLIGHSESLAGVAHGLEYVRPATYRMGRRA